MCLATNRGRPSQVGNAKIRVPSASEMEKFNSAPKSTPIRTDQLPYDPKGFYKTDDEREAARSRADVIGTIKEPAPPVRNNDVIKDQVRTAEEERIKGKKGRSSTIRSGSNGLTNTANTASTGLLGG